MINTEEEKNKFSIFIYKEKTKMAKLKKLVKENFSLVGGVVSVPAINAGYSSLSKIVKEKYGETITKRFHQNK